MTKRLATIAAALILGGCASTLQMTLMPRDSGKLYHGTLEGDGGTEGPIAITIEGRTYTGTWVEVVPDRSTGYVAGGWGGARPRLGHGRVDFDGQSRRRRGQGAPALARRRRPALRPARRRRARRRRRLPRRQGPASTTCRFARRPAPVAPATTDRPTTRTTTRDDHAPQRLRHPQDLPARPRQDRPVLLPAGARGEVPQREAPARLDPHRARVGAAQRRRQEGLRGAREAARRLGRHVAAHRRRSRSCWRASCCRTSRACRCSPTSPRCAGWPRRWAGTPR